MIGLLMFVLAAGGAAVLVLVKGRDLFSPPAPPPPLPVVELPEGALPPGWRPPAAPPPPPDRTRQRVAAAFGVAVLCAGAVTVERVLADGKRAEPELMATPDPFSDTVVHQDAVLHSPARLGGLPRMYGPAAVREVVLQTRAALLELGASSLVTAFYGGPDRAYFLLATPEMKGYTVAQMREEMARAMPGASTGRAYTGPRGEPLVCFSVSGLASRVVACSWSDAKSGGILGGYGAAGMADVAAVAGEAMRKLPEGPQ